MHNKFRPFSLFSAIIKEEEARPQLSDRCATARYGQGTRTGRC